MLAASNDRIKRLRKLIKQRQARSSERAFVVEGPVLVAEALAAQAAGLIEVLEVYVDEEMLSIPDGAQVVDELHWVRSGVLAGVLATVSPQPVCAVVRVPEHSFDTIGDGPILGVVDLSDPGNAGTLLRTAEAAGFAAVAMIGSSVDTTNPKVVRASAGARLRLPVLELHEVNHAFASLRGSGREVVVTVVDPDAGDYADADLANVALILGNEAAGLPDATIALADRSVTIPLAGPTESLNVAAAGAILCFESLRQRRVGRPSR
jgi:TrmH family RNA methyltransferase